MRVDRQLLVVAGVGESLNIRTPPSLLPGYFELVTTLGASFGDRADCGFATTYVPDALSRASRAFPRHLHAEHSQPHLANHEPICLIRFALHSETHVGQFVA